jgi:hypothetical protein
MMVPMENNFKVESYSSLIAKIIRLNARKLDI